MTISKWETAALTFSGLFLAFTAGWFLRGSVTAEPVRVETQRTLTVTVTAPAEPEVTFSAVSEPEESVDAGALRSPEPEPAPAPSAPQSGGRININTADAQTLMTLPGIGEKRAADIIADREQNGPYRYPEDITRVKGIGEATMKKILNDITVED